MAGNVHDWLCHRAYHWLLTAGGCRWALRETGESPHGERPDALGWRTDSRSILIECKATRSDFHSDKKKIFRDTENWKHGLGQDRYYMAPPGVITPDLLPKDWGLLECYQYKVVERVAPPVLIASKAVLLNEVRLLFNLLSDLPETPLRHNYEHQDYVDRINRMLGDERPWENKKPAKPKFR